MDQYMNYFKLKGVFISLCVLSILISCMSFISSITIYYSAQENNLWYFENILRSWKTKPISSLEIKTSPCAEGEEFINQHWELTFEGCHYYEPQNCQKSFDDDNEGANPLIMGNIDNFPRGLNITKWKQKNICAKRLDLNYFNMKLTDKDKPCDKDEVGNDHKTCGAIDSLGNRLCLPKDQTCPKTFKEIKEEKVFKDAPNLFKNYKNEDDKDFKKVVKDSKYFNETYNEDDVDKNIMVQTFIRRNPLCYSYATEMRNRINPPKTFFNQDWIHECSTLKFKDEDGSIIEKDIPLSNFDERAKLIDWYDVDQLYKENDVYIKIEGKDKSKKLSPALKKISNDTISLLFYNNYPGINIECLKNFTKENSKEEVNANLNERKIPFDNTHLNDIQNVQAFLFCEFLSIMFNGVFIIIEIIVFKDNWFRAAENKDPLVELKYILSNYTYLKLSVFVGYFCFVFCTTLTSSIYYYYLSQALMYITKIFGDKNCVDRFTYELLFQTCEQLKIKRERYTTPLCFCVFYLLIYILTIYMSAKTLKKFDEVEEMLREKKKENRIDDEKKLVNNNDVKIIHDDSYVNNINNENGYGDDKERNNLKNSEKANRLSNKS